jgi:hypothetical protein
MEYEAIYLSECRPMSPIAVEHVVLADDTRLDPSRAINTEAHYQEVSTAHKG